MESVRTYFIGDIIAGSSAEKVDMHDGDRVVSINGVPVTGLENAQVLSIISAR